MTEYGAGMDFHATHRARFLEAISFWSSESHQGVAIRFARPTTLVRACAAGVGSRRERFVLVGYRPPSAYRTTLLAVPTSARASAGIAMGGAPSR